MSRQKYHILNKKHTLGMDNIVEVQPAPAIQADIFDHLLAAAPEFGLRIFQNPSGYDLRCPAQIEAMA